MVVRTSCRLILWPMLRNTSVDSCLFINHEPLSQVTNYLLHKLRARMCSHVNASFETQFSFIYPKRLDGSDYVDPLGCNNCSIYRRLLAVLSTLLCFLDFPPIAYSAFGGILGGITPLRPGLGERLNWKRGARDSDAPRSNQISRTNLRKRSGSLAGYAQSHLVAYR